MATKKPKPVTAAPSPAEGAQTRATAARVLVACEHGHPDDVVHLNTEELAAAVAAGQVDPHPDAVAYAAALKH